MKGAGGGRAPKELSPHNNKVAKRSSRAGQRRPRLALPPLLPPPQAGTRGVERQCWVTLAAQAAPLMIKSKLNDARPQGHVRSRTAAGAHNWAAPVRASAERVEQAAAVRLVTVRKSSHHHNKSKAPLSAPQPAMNPAAACPGHARGGPMPRAKAHESIHCQGRRPNLQNKVT